MFFWNNKKLWKSNGLQRLMTCSVFLYSITNVFWNGLNMNCWIQFVLLSRGQYTSFYRVGFRLENTKRYIYLDIDGWKWISDWAMFKNGNELFFSSPCCHLLIILVVIIFPNYAIVILILDSCFLQMFMLC